MICGTCQHSGLPGFVRTRRRIGTEDRDVMIPCPDCGGQGVAHCCDGICEQPGTADDSAR